MLVQIKRKGVTDVTRDDHRAVWKSILRNHPFFKYAGYQPWGWDWRTFGMLYPRSASIMRQALLAVMNLEPTGVVDVARTSDGFYLGQQEGDMGYNQFLGAPEPSHPGPGRDASQQKWEALSLHDQRMLVIRAMVPPNGVPVPLKDFLGFEPGQES